MDPRTAPSIFTRGAVDLGALRPSTPPPAASRPAEPGPSGAPQPGGGGVVIDVTEATFQTEVLERSMTVPVIIEFWAEGYPGGDGLSPVLAKLADEAAGTWVLARVDVRTQQRLAQMLRVQGIPMVYAVVGGQGVDAFTGVMPEPQLRQWLQGILKAGGVEAELPGDPRLDAADDALMAGDLDAAEAAYKKILGETPNDQSAEAGLAQVGLLRRIQGVDPNAVLAAAREAPTDVAKQTLAADVEVISGMAEAAYKRLVELVRRTAGDERETARRHLVGLFVLAGPEDPAVAAARRALASALF
jgi:putative thioredoxin